MKQFLDFMRHVRRNGAAKADRTGTGTLSVFGYQMRFDLAAGFPLVTTKRVHFKSIAYELLWFLRGDTNTKYLREHGVSIWDEWADANGELGPVYGKQWRSWPAPDGREIEAHLVAEHRERAGAGAVGLGSAVAADVPHEVEKLFHGLCFMASGRLRCRGEITRGFAPAICHENQREPDQQHGQAQHDAHGDPGRSEQVIQVMVGHAPELHGDAR